ELAARGVELALLPREDAEEGERPGVEPAQTALADAGLAWPQQRLGLDQLAAEVVRHRGRAQRDALEERARRGARQIERLAPPPPAACRRAAIAGDDREDGQRRRVDPDIAAAVRDRARL